MLKNLISSSGNLYRLLNAIDSHIPVSVFGVGRQEKILILDESSDKKLIVAVNDDEAVNYYETLMSENKSVDLLINNLETQVSKFSSATQINVLKTLQDIVTDNVDYVVVSPKVLLDKLPSPKMVKDLILTIKEDESYDINSITKKLVKMGYRKDDIVNESMEFSVKGDILMVYPINMDYPVKISFFDDQVEFIKEYNPDNQSIIGSLDSINIYSANFIIDNPTSQNKLSIKASKFNDREAEETFNNTISEVNISLDNGILPVWAKVYMPDYDHSIFEFFDDGIVAFDNPKLVLTSLVDTYQDIKNEFKEDIKNGLITDKHKDFYFHEDELFQFKNCGLVAFQNINNANNIFKPKAVFSIPTTPQINYSYNKSTLYSDMARQILLGYTIVIFAESKELAQKLSDMFLPKNVSTNIIPSLSQVQKNCVNLITKSSCLSCGFDEDKLIIIGLKSQKQKPKTNGGLTSSYDVFMPEVGDFVVHSTYGIGKCVGITQLNVKNAKKDYIEIEYRNNDKLFLPVENIDSISKYVGGDKPKLNKLGSTEFLKTKQKVKESIKKLTFDLKKLYAERSQIKGIMFPLDDEIQLEFEKACPYTLTVDQDKAVTDMKKDMESPRVMDRLICGDVGYGKTEVAIRGAFKAVMAGYQVMVLCPTTILSEQHYNTFESRLKTFGVKCEVLNRFRNNKDTLAILEDFANGNIDILIGTHKLLNENVKPKNLGLLILDEEQRFGVEHKEKIKRFKSNIDVLTLSATPIPRTLHSALIGIKDVSVIQTPPNGRVPVITTVTESNDAVIGNAVSRELERCGQVLIIYNRVESIYEYLAYIRRIVGNDVSIDIAHGQMDEKTLEKAIFKLYNGDTQILISTTLIENGVDLPRANTLIVNNADMLGLSQLYQLKGRIGRSDRQAYAIFMYDKGRMLSEEAYKRLGAIVEYSGLGNGYKIAMRDLEIRGAGSIFGAEQSGHIESVGYSMYLSLLSEAIKENGDTPKLELNDVKIDCYFDANLPNYYVENSSNRIEIYTEIAKLKSEEDIVEYTKKLEFNFGSVPQEVLNLMYVAVIKNSSVGLDIRRISICTKETSITFNSSTPKLLKALTNVIASNRYDVVLNLENLPIITINSDVNLLTNMRNIKELLKVLYENLNK